MARSLLVLAVFAVLAGCSSADDGSGSGTTSSTSTSVPRTVTSDRQWDGIAYPVWDAEAYGGGEVAGGLADIAALGARVVTIIPTWYVDDTSTSLPARDPDQTATDESLRAAIDEAHRLGLAVLLKPHVDRHDDGDRAEIVPSDPGAWFSRYRGMIVGYAELAAETEVEMFSVGTELAGTVSQHDEWSATISAVRSVYSGRLTYAANFDSYAQVAFWDELDVIGVDAYFELADEPTTDVDELVAAWGPALDGMAEFAAEHSRTVMFTEAGYVSQVGTTTEPWNWEISDEASVEEQAAAYAALLDVVSDRPWIDGVQWWMWDDLADTGEDQSLDYTPHGKLAEQVLREAWER